MQLPVTLQEAAAKAAKLLRIGRGKRLASAQKVVPELSEVMCRALGSPCAAAGA